MSEPTKAGRLTELAKQMGDAGYCNYDACREYLELAYQAGRESMREAAAKVADDIADMRWKSHDAGRQEVKNAAAGSLGIRIAQAIRALPLAPGKESE